MAGIGTGQIGPTQRTCAKRRSKPSLSSLALIRDRPRNQGPGDPGWADNQIIIPGDHLRGFCYKLWAFTGHETIPAHTTQKPTLLYFLEGSTS